MKFLLNTVFLVIFLKNILTVAFEIDLNQANEEIIKQYESFKTQYSDTEKAIREKVLLQNIDLIKSHNAKFAIGKETYELGLNQFSDWTAEEFNSILGYKGAANYKGPLDVFGGVLNFFLSAAGAITSFVGYPSYPKVEDDGKTFDFRENRCWGKILDQKKCGSCYAFSALQVLNFNECVKCQGSVTYSSIQNIVDCSEKQKNNGCDGGLMEYVFDYMKQSPGVNQADKYPYVAAKRSCKFEASEAEYKEIEGYTELEKDENEIMKKIQQTESVCVAVRVDNKFQQYKGGVFGDDLSCRTLPFQLNHAVTVEGYGKDEATGKMYWLVKNSWGEKWGEKGYIRILRGSCCTGICLKAGVPNFKCRAQNPTLRYQSFNSSSQEIN